MSPSHEEDRATSEAARWVVALEEDPDDAEVRARFDAWLKASPANQAAWAATADIYDMMGKVKPAHPEHWMPYVIERGGVAPAPVNGPRAGIGRARPAGQAVRRSRAMTPRRLAVGVAAAALAACLAVFVAPTVLLRMEADYVTSTAELRAVPLEDGSTVRLGPDSAIALAFDASGRRVKLLRGEAFFEVTPDPNRPFRVGAGGVETTVLGTAFDVRLGEMGATVAVRHGRVRVAYPAARPPLSERLEAGEWVRVAWTGEVDQGAIPPGEVASWLDGQIVARDRPLAEVVDDLRRYYGGMIVLTDGDLGRRRVSGVYNVADPAAALRAMVGAHGGAVRQVSPWVLVVSGG